MRSFWETSGADECTLFVWVSAEYHGCWSGEAAFGLPLHPLRRTVGAVGRMILGRKEVVQLTQPPKRDLYDYLVLLMRVVEIFYRNYK